MKNLAPFAEIVGKAVAMEAHRSEERNVSILLPAAGLWVENGYVLSVDCSSELEAFQVQVSRWSRRAEKGNGSDATSSTTGKVVGR